ncbi:tRNA epoxyqueuosine(34) reductase QueG [Methyloceanibacter caenitepidi]|uniref:Epoxyqueuosine reductase n=1 Tax=Methyloceanibacter caenitepidi TaxID=1384459 RepID=A0A0A8JYW7_9HYPH|nr:tRNA epoxyqueuosine(34) reductase QueG [Methyloceanibacter caenitepidi]BAQ15993.1 epoxyqueuosine (oQ) reductase QueG [Methyloceanibacter caenitepidi]
MGQSLKQTIAERAEALGFDVMRITGADAPARIGSELDAFLAQGREGDMGWLKDTAERRKSPQALWPDVRSVILLGTNYGGPEDPLASLRDASRGAVSIYAKRADYHDVIKGKLKQLARQIQALAGGDVKVFVDTAPVMEKPLAAKAGLGWQGKHTNLVSREFGSWLFLGSIFTTADIEADAPEIDHCGACCRCLDACPTKAFTAPYEIDARRCISYLTIEHKGHIAREFRAAMGNRIYGCDDCLAVCPWNKFAQASHETKLAIRPETDDPPLAEILALDDAAFRERFRGTPIKRTGRDRFVRNALIAAGNAADTSLVPHVEALIDDASPLVRAMAAWALQRLDPARSDTMRAERLAAETDSAVRAEWQETAGALVP